jgi:hypothetical protein
MPLMPPSRSAVLSSPVMIDLICVPLRGKATERWPA